MISVVFYKFTKKLNSLKKPSSTDTSVSYNCLLREPTSIIHPVLEIIGGTNVVSDTITEYNYVYISKFKRYYFVNDIVYRRNSWIISLNVDVLASYWSDIVNSRQYVVRSSSSFNEDIIDNEYPSLPADASDTWNYSQNSIRGSVQQKNLTTGNWANTTFFNKDITQGSVCIGIVSNNFSGVNYYIMPVDRFNTLVQKTFAVVPSDMPDVSTGLAQAMYNPLQYFVSCIWFPFNLSLGTDGVMVRSVNIGPYEVDFGGIVDTFCYKITSGTIGYFKCEFDVPRHPDYSSNHYLRFSPFSKYNLFFQPFGNIPVDTTLLNGSPRLVCEWDVDVTQGDSILRLYNYTNDGLIYTTNTSVGVTLPLSSITMSPLSSALVMATSFLGNALDQVGSTLSSNNLVYEHNVPIPYGAAGTYDPGLKYQPMEQPQQSGTGGTWRPNNSNIVTKFSDVLAASFGQVITKGNASSFIGYGSPPILYAWFTRQAQRDVTRLGAPLYKDKRLDNLTGFCKCLRPTVDFSSYPTDYEIGLVISYLENGIYIE